MITLHIKLVAPSKKQKTKKKKKKETFDNAQNLRIYIILRTRKGSGGPLISNDTLYGTQWFWQTAIGGCL